jgi:hypothetical protein
MSTIPQNQQLSRSPTQSKSCLHRFSKSMANTIPCNESIDNSFNRMLFISRQFRSIALSNLYDSSIHPYPGKSLSGHLIQDSFVLTLPSTYDRCKYHKARTLRQTHYPIDHLLWRLLRYHTPALRTMWVSSSCIEHSKVVVNLRNCTNRRSGIMTGCFLIYRNCRRESLYGIDIRLFHLTKELPCICGQ